MIEKLFKNKGIKNLLLKQFNQLVKDENIKTVVIKISDTGEMIPEFYNKKMVAVDEETYKAIMNKLKSITNE